MTDRATPLEEDSEEPAAAEPLRAGLAALRRHRWGEAFDLLTQADRAGSLGGPELESLAEAAFFANNIVLMRAGKIVQHGSYRDLTESPAEEFVREFVNAQRGLHIEALNA